MKPDSITISSIKIEKLEQLIQEKINNSTIKLSLEYKPMQYYENDTPELKFIYLVLNITALFKDCAPWLKLKEKINGLKILSYSVRFDIKKCKTEEEKKENTKENLILNTKCDAFCNVVKECFLYRALLAHNYNDIKISPELEEELIPLDFYDKRDGSCEKKYKEYLSKLDDFLDILIQRFSIFNKVTNFDITKWKNNLYNTLIAQNKPTFFAQSLINALLPIYRKNNKYSYIDKKQVEEYFEKSLIYVMDNNPSELNPINLIYLIFSYLGS